MLYRVIFALLFLTLSLPFSTEAQFSALRPNTSTNVTNNQIDIIVESDTYVPHFYQGRAEPTPGNTIRLLAIVYAPGANNQNLSYRWTVSGSLLPTNTAQASIRAGYGDTLVRVQALSDDGQIVAEREEYVSVASPVIRFYEQNSLRGLSRIAIGTQHIAVGPEIAIKAEPYFIGRNDAPPNLRSGWTVGGTAVVVLEDWRVLNIENRPATYAPAQIDFSVQNSTTLLKANGTFSLLFNL